MEVPQPLLEFCDQSYFPPQSKAIARSRDARFSILVAGDTAATKLSISIKSYGIQKGDIEYFLCDAQRNCRLPDEDQVLKITPEPKRKDTKRARAQLIQFEFTCRSALQRPAYIRFQLRDRPHQACVSYPLLVVHNSRDYNKALKKIMWHVLASVRTPPLSQKSSKDRDDLSVVHALMQDTDQF